MDNLTKGALGATILVALGAVGFAVTNMAKSEKENLALRQQIQSEQKQREDDKAAEMERRLKDSEAQQEKQREQMNAQLDALRAQMVSGRASAEEERRIIAAEREALSATIADSVRSESVPEESLTKLQKKIREAASIGAVAQVEQELGFVIVSAGSANGIQPEQRYNVRRDMFIVAEILIMSVEDERHSVANIVPGSTQPGLTIRAGDELIGHPIF